MRRILITCPPMLRDRARFLPRLREKGFGVHCPEVVQTLSEPELIDLVPQFDAWIIGDDPATERVLRAGAAGKLRVAVKWGVGVDNVDRAACRTLGIAFSNTPGMFGSDVADLALHYVIALARQTYLIDRGVRSGGWPKPRGLSLQGKRAGVVGYGDIGEATAARLLACRMNVLAHDPAKGPADVAAGVELRPWPELAGSCDFLIFTCALTDTNRHMLNEETLASILAGTQAAGVSARA